MQNCSTCFGCLSHPSSGVHQTVTAASDTGHITCQSNNLPPAWPNYYSTCFGCLSHPSSGVHQTVTAASGTGTGHTVRATTFRQRGLIGSRRRKVVALTRDTTCTRSCSYILMYSKRYVMCEIRYITNFIFMVPCIVTLY